jgi:hypothetical protein
VGYADAGHVHGLVPALYFWPHGKGINVLSGDARRHAFLPAAAQGLPRAEYLARRAELFHGRLRGTGDFKGGRGILTAFAAESPDGKQGGQRGNEENGFHKLARQSPIERPR